MVVLAGLAGWVEALEKVVKLKEPLARVAPGEAAVLAVPLVQKA
jgi:hypothetical protein